MSHKILVTGGSGYIGKQVVSELSSAGYDVTVVDVIEKPDNIPGLMIRRDYDAFFLRNKIKYDTVIHLAAEHMVSASVKSPAKYYVNNVVKMKTILDNMVQVGIKNIIFSSTGNIYGRQGLTGPCSEDMYYDPMNPYASTKVAGEMMIKDYAGAYGINYVNFRYFNPAGADPLCRFGYVQTPITHVIPALCNASLSERPFTIYGKDYPTVDGTCVRDYVHVGDLATAHRKAIEYFDGGGSNVTLNLGGGHGGCSVNQLANVIEDVTGIKMDLRYETRRAGDPTQLIADISSASKVLGWSPTFDIKDIITHALAWENKCNFKG